MALSSVTRPGTPCSATRSRLLRILSFFSCMFLTPLLKIRQLADTDGYSQRGAFPLPERLFCDLNEISLNSRQRLCASYSSKKYSQSEF